MVLRDKCNLLGVLLTILLTYSLDDSVVVAIPVPQRMNLFSLGASSPLKNLPMNRQAKTRSGSKQNDIEIPIKSPFTGVMSSGPSSIRDALQYVPKPGSDTGKVGNGTVNNSTQPFGTTMAKARDAQTSVMEVMADGANVPMSSGNGVVESLGNADPLGFGGNSMSSANPAGMMSSVDGDKMAKGISTGVVKSAQMPVAAAADSAGVAKTLSAGVPGPLQAPMAKASDDSVVFSDRVMGASQSMSGVGPSNAGDVASKLGESAGNLIPGTPQGNGESSVVELANAKTITDTMGQFAPKGISTDPSSAMNDFIGSNSKQLKDVANPTGLAGVMSVDRAKEFTGGLPDGIPKGMPEGVSKSIGDAIPDGVPKSLSDVMPEGLGPESVNSMNADSGSNVVMEQLGQGFPSVRSGLSERVPQALTDALPEGISKPITSGFAEGIPSSITETFSEGVAKQMSSGIPKSFSEGLPDGVSKPFSDAVPEGIPKQLSQGLPSSLVENVPQGVPKSMGEAVPKSITDAFSSLSGAGSPQSVGDNIKDANPFKDGVLSDALQDPSGTNAISSIMADGPQTISENVLSAPKSMSNTVNAAAADSPSALASNLVTGSLSMSEGLNKYLASPASRSRSINTPRFIGFRDKGGRRTKRSPQDAETSKRLADFTLAMAQNPYFKSVRSQGLGVGQGFLSTLDKNLTY